jgi:hypothetical protein
VKTFIFAIKIRERIIKNKMTSTIYITSRPGRSIILSIIAIFYSMTLLAQSDNEGLNSKYYELFNRLDIKLRDDSVLSFTTVKPFSRQLFTAKLEILDSLEKSGLLAATLSKVDKYNIRSFLADNSEWTSSNSSFNVSNQIINKFYKGTPNLFSVNTRNFILKVDPLLNLQFGHSNGKTKSLYQNSRGILLRGSLDKKIGFYTTVTDNQERVPDYVQEWVRRHNALPGVGFYKTFKKDGYDYFNMTGGITFRAAKYINFKFAYDKLFVGNGFRSLYLSDFSNNYLFMRMNARFWKLKYEMVIAETMQSVPQVRREMKPRNYMALHHLSAQLTPWLNVGFYENIMEEGRNGLQLSYLNPMIFYRAAESNLGAAGKANIGIDVKANINRNIQLYGQLLINEFIWNEVRNYKNGSYANKHAFQVGGKYIDAFGIPNLDLQGEINYIRPFTYTNFDSLTNLTHYNQPLAHPLEANVREIVTLLNYQPLPRLYLKGRITYFIRGLDSLDGNIGSNIFRSYLSRPRDYGFFIGTGIPVKSLTAAFAASYEVFGNMFLDLNVSYRNYNIVTQSKSSVLFYNMGFRVNMSPRTFNF